MKWGRSIYAFQKLLILLTGLEIRVISFLWVSGLKTWQRRFALVQENEVSPQLRSIQECYASTIL